MTRRTLLAAAACLTPAGGAGAEALRPPPGAPERRAILDALRVPVAAAIGGRIEFAVNELRVLDDWAYVAATPRRPGGRSIDWSRTRYAAAMRADAMSDLVLGLLRREAGRWRVVVHAIGPTDVAWIEWIDRHGAPRRLFADE